LFLGGPCTSCADARDVNDDGRADISDAIVLLVRLFGDSPPLPERFESCGLDATPDALVCPADGEPCE
jgi:hypothetical protein